MTDSVLHTLFKQAGYTDEQIAAFEEAREDEVPYKCTWSQTGYAYGVYVNNGENCETCSTPMTIENNCPRCMKE
jgi:hypothetical protein